MKYLLDTNTCIFIINHKSSHVFDIFRQHNLADIGISSITACELAFGVAKSNSTKNKLALERFLLPITIAPFDKTAICGQLRHHLQSKGTPIGSLDMLIATHALALDATLVTNNTKEFSRVPDLSITDWL